VRISDTSQPKHCSNRFVERIFGSAAWMRCLVCVAEKKWTMMGHRAPMVRRQTGCLGLHDQGVIVFTGAYSGFI